MIKHINITISIIIAVLLFLTTMVGCQSEQQHVTVEVPADSVLKKTVRVKLNQAEHLVIDSIEVSAREGVVLLQGTVDNLLTKDRATRLAERTSGVLTVVNNLTVESNRADPLISRDVNSALRTDPATEDWELHADVQNGHVTLLGSVDSWQEKRLARKIAASVKGVVNITNNIVVGYNEVRKPEHIRAEIREMLQWDSRLNASNINIQVDGFTAVLSGQVGSLEEKQIAKRIAHVLGVKEVNAQSLNVRPSFQRNLAQQEIAGQITEEQQKRAIFRAMQYDPRVDTANIDVAVNNGTAILTGTVNHLITKLNAGQNAINTVGIHTVNNNITVQHKLIVKPDVPTTDQGIEKRIEAMINRDPYVELVEVDIEVNDGQVMLKGKVSSQYEKEHITSLAERVKGVVSINNQITVDQEKAS